ncbi:hypothetical protein B0H14DRAFT_2496171 [Mycena olivaceomarginata]|nr:hypothetical protein B0H14DRAFT_2496171 [Mycena olivaceomarginata]
MSRGRRQDATEGLPTVPSTGAGQAHWADSETLAALAWLCKPDIHARAGDGGNFPAAVWQELYAYLAPFLIRGAPKTAKVCQNKYTQLWATHKIVEHVAGNSGWAYSNEYGANIDDTTKSTWDDYVKAHPKAKPYRNRGWEFRNAMRLLIPPRAHGTHVYRATEGQQLQPAPAADPGDEDDDDLDEDPDAGGDNPVVGPMREGHCRYRSQRRRGSTSPRECTDLGDGCHCRSRHLLLSLPIRW